MNKKIILILLSAIFYIFAQDKLELTFFGSGTCGECHELKVEYLIPLLDTHKDSLYIDFIDTDTKEGMQKLLSYEEKFNIDKGSAQELYFPDTVILGFEKISTDGIELIKKYLNNPTKWNNKKEVNLISDDKETAEALKEKVDSFSFWAIVSFGLIDGINPCAIATMIFLISFMAMKKRTRKEILIIGLSYTATVFITYTLIGVVAFESLTMLKKISIVSEIVKWIAVAFALSVSIISFIDAFNYKKSNDSNSIKLQLPNSLKMKIHTIINSNLSGKQLFIGAISTGFLVTIIETFCTGQTYLPAIQAMVKTSGVRFEGWLRLLFYNFLFVLPLLLVMIGAYFGLTWEHLSKKTQDNMVFLKILLGVVMLLLSVYLIAN